MEKTHIIIILLILIIVMLINKLYNSRENITSTDSGKTLSDEALQNIASVYNTQNMIVTNLKATGDINFAQFKGIIVAWSGAVADIPKGWGFCDGTKYKALDGTDLQSPDLRSKFIVGASKPGTTLDTTNGSYRPNYPGLWLAPRQVGDQGGEENHTLTIDEMPKHNHPAWRGFANSTGGARFGYATNDNWAYDQPDDPNNRNGFKGGDKSHNTMPPFFALAYIIKL